MVLKSRGGNEAILVFHHSAAITIIFNKKIFKKLKIVVDIQNSEWYIRQALPMRAAQEP